MRVPQTQAVVVTDAERTMTHRQLRERAGRLASVFHGRGLRRGDVVAVLASDVLAVVEVLLAAEHGGLIALPVDPSFSLEEAAYVVNDSAAAAVVVGSGFSASAEALAVLTPAVKARWSVGRPLVGHMSLEVARSTALPRQRGAATSASLHYGVTHGRPTGRLVQDDLVGVTGLLGPGAVVLATSSMADPFTCRLMLSTIAQGGTVVTAGRPSTTGVLRALALHRPTVLELEPRVATALAALSPHAWLPVPREQIGHVFVAPGCRVDTVARLTELWGSQLTYWGEAGPLRDIERVLAAHEAVADVAVTAWRSPLVVVEPMTGVVINATLEARLRAQIADAGIQLPAAARMVFVSRMPRTSSGAVDRRRLVHPDLC
jgi:fatty-acyl-CoA synthase